ncbi:membrane fusion protein, multidrug efflux system [Cupriavidus metallidurans]|nr:HlyD family secretion protein [Cupriavidus pauculus]HBD33943.1 hypothetical protein [Cupriavidus sp.]
MIRRSKADVDGDPARTARHGRKGRWALLFGRPHGTTRARTVKRIILVSAVLLAAVMAASYPALSGHDVQSTDDAYVRADVTPVAARVEGYLADVPVHDNQRVHAGDVLALVQDVDYRERVVEAQASAERADAALAEAISQNRYQQSQVAAAAAAMQATQADLDRAAADRTRYHAMLPSGSASRQQVDVIDAEVRRLSANLAQRHAEWMAAQQQVQTGNASIDEARATVQATRSILNSRKIDLGWTRITAPVDGVVGERHVRPGVYVRAGTLIVDVVPLPHVWVVANFREGQLTHIHPGQHVSIRVDSLPGLVFKGTVDSLQPASGAQFALLPPDNATGNFTKVVQRFPVKIMLDPDQNSQASLLPGMSVIASVETPGGSRPSGLVSGLSGWLRGRL